MSFLHFSAEALFLFGGGFGLWMAFRAIRDADSGRP